MDVIMNLNSITTLQQITCFLDGTQEVSLSFPSKDTRYRFVQETLAHFHYRTAAKADKGLLRRYIIRVTGYSRAQVARLITQFLQRRQIVRRHGRTGLFPTRYTPAHIKLLARTDELHGTLSGPATKKLCERAYQLFGQQEYRQLAQISVSHLYRLRKSISYGRQRRFFAKTRPRPIPIGQRRAPRPNGQPGFVRVDTVHQGDLDGVKGLYHINAVDEVTQYEIVCGVERISERFLVPALELLLHQFPFITHGFHSDNGSEYINRYVVRLLNKLLIELTKSRARHSNDNALVECKNGSIIRKHLGYSHIPQRYAAQVNLFHQNYLNPYVNYHRPCFFPVVKTDAKGKQYKSYPYASMMTPYDKLKSLPQAHGFLKPGLTFDQLDAKAYEISDTEAAKRMQEEKRKLFENIMN
ncbi:MAG: integrase [Myxococcota bacterium]